MGYSKVLITGIPDGTYGKVNEAIGHLKDTILELSGFASLHSDNNPGNTVKRDVYITMAGSMHKLRLYATTATRINIILMNVANTAALQTAYADVDATLTFLYGSKIFAICGGVTAFAFLTSTLGNLMYCRPAYSSYKHNSDTGGSLATYSATQTPVETTGANLLIPHRFVFNSALAQERADGNLFVGSAIGFAVGDLYRDADEAVYMVLGSNVLVKCV